MGNKIEVDSFLKKYSAENPEIASSLVVNFEKIEQGAIQRTSKPKSGWRTAAVIAAIFLIFTAGAFFSDSGVVKAYRQKALVFLHVISGEDTTKGSNGSAIISSQPDIAAVQEQVPFHIMEPHWLPEGYAFDSIKLTDSKDSRYRVVARYSNGEDEISILLNNDTSGLAESTPADAEAKCEEIDVQGTKVYLWGARDPEQNSLAVFQSKGGLLINVSAPLDKQAMLQLILGLY